jgi:hypothetical protein
MCKIFSPFSNSNEEKRKGEENSAALQFHTNSKPWHWAFTGRPYTGLQIKLHQARPTPARTAAGSTNLQATRERPRSPPRGHRTDPTQVPNQILVEPNRERTQRPAPWRGLSLPRRSSAARPSSPPQPRPGPARTGRSPSSRTPSPYSAAAEDGSSGRPSRRSSSPGTAPRQRSQPALLRRRRRRMARKMVARPPPAAASFIRSVLVLRSSCHRVDGCFVCACNCSCMTASMRAVKHEH